VPANRSIAARRPREARALGVVRAGGRARCLRCAAALAAFAALLDGATTPVAIYGLRDPLVGDDTPARRYGAATKGPRPNREGGARRSADGSI